MDNTDNKPRFEFIPIELADWKNYAIIDNKTDKILLHLVAQNGSEYCKEFGKKIANLLNSN